MLIANWWKYWESIGSGTRYASHHDGSAQLFTNSFWLTDSKNWFRETFIVWLPRLLRNTSQHVPLVSHIFNTFSWRGFTPGRAFGEPVASDGCWTTGLCQRLNMLLSIAPLNHPHDWTPVSIFSWLGNKAKNGKIPAYRVFHFSSSGAFCVNVRMLLTF